MYVRHHKCVTCLAEHEYPGLEVVAIVVIFFYLPRKSKCSIKCKMLGAQSNIRTCMHMCVNT